MGSLEGRIGRLREIEGWTGPPNLLSLEEGVPRLYALKPEFRLSSQNKILDPFGKRPWSHLCYPKTNAPDGYCCCNISVNRKQEEDPFFTAQVEVLGSEGT